MSELQNPFQLYRTGPFQPPLGGPAGAVVLVASQHPTSVTFTFNDTTFAPSGGSLIDGVYRFTAYAAYLKSTDGVAYLDGNGDGIGGDDYQLSGAQNNDLFRLFGDLNGDGIVNIGDRKIFNQAFGATSMSDPNYNFACDYNNDGRVDQYDLDQFNLRYGSNIFSELPPD